MPPSATEGGIIGGRVASGFAAGHGVRRVTPGIKGKDSARHVSVLVGNSKDGRPSGTATRESQVCGRFRGVNANVVGADGYVGCSKV